MRFYVFLSQYGLTRSNLTNQRQALFVISGRVIK